MHDFFTIAFDLDAMITDSLLCAMLVLAWNTYEYRHGRMKAPSDANMQILQFCGLSLGILSASACAYSRHAHLAGQQSTNCWPAWRNHDRS